MANKPTDRSLLHPATKTVTAAHEFNENGAVNPAIYRASTILFNDLETYDTGNQPYTYGRRGTPTSRALEAAMMELEGAAGCCLYPSGLSAIAGTLLGMLNEGDHLLMTDSAYGPTRSICDNLLPRYGIKTSYYDPTIGKSIDECITPDTKLIFTESPGSQTMEMQDIPAICEIAKKHQIPVAIDNTWSAGYLFNAISVGCEISLQAATKYITGHSDTNLGTVCATQYAHERILKTHGLMGINAGPEECYQGLRGLRTMPTRLKAHMESALIIAEWLKAQDHVVDEVLYPALPGSPGHDIWKRDYCGASGLFSVLLKPASRKALAALIDELEFFGLGASWGGYESLILPFNPEKHRTATKWHHTGNAIRLHIGLENPDDLMRDLDQGLKRYQSVD